MTLPTVPPGDARILVITKSTGGVAAYNLTLCEHLHEKGYGVSVICLSDDNESYARRLEDHGISTTTMEMARYTIAPVSDLLLAMRLIRHVRRHPADAIIAHGAKAGFLGRLAGRLAGVPVLYVVHAMSFLRRVRGQRAILYRQLERLGSLLGGHFVAISRSMRDELSRCKIATATAVTVVHTGIDAERFTCPRDPSEARQALGLDANRPVVGWAGRLHPDKAPLAFIRAAELVTRSVPGVQFFMAGDGPLADDVRALAQRLGLGDRLIAGGWQDDMRPLYSALDLYAATSLSEGLPVTLLEAMAAGRPAVATAVGGVPEVIRDGVDGYLVDVGDHQAMARHCERLLLDDRRRDAMGRAAKERVTTCFTVERMMAGWQDLIEKQLFERGEA